MTPSFLLSGSQGKKENIYKEEEQAIK